jgi:hypothetical protein
MRKPSVHSGQLARAEDAARFVAETHVQQNEIGFLQQLVAGDELDAVLAGERFVAMTRAREQPHLKAARAPGDRLADVPEADDAECLVKYCAAHSTGAAAFEMI